MMPSKHVEELLHLGMRRMLGESTIRSSFVRLILTVNTISHLDGWYGTCCRLVARRSSRQRKAPIDRCSLELRQASRYVPTAVDTAHSNAQAQCNSAAC